MDFHKDEEFSSEVNVFIVSAVLKVNKHIYRAYLQNIFFDEDNVV